MLKIGHRGIAGLEPENSMAGFRRAVELGVKALEMDVRLSHDGVPVVFHDHLLDRLTDSSGYLHDFSFARLTAEVRLNNGESIPRLQDVLALLADHMDKFYIEIKSPQAVAVVLQVLEQGPLADRCVISSFYHQALLQIRGHDSSRRIMALFECSPLDPLALVAGLQPEEVGLGFASIDPEAVTAFRQSGIEVYAWTVNDERDIALAEAYGLSGVFTDYPV